MDFNDLGGLGGGGGGGAGSSATSGVNFITPGAPPHADLGTVAGFALVALILVAALLMFRK